MNAPYLNRKKEAEDEEEQKLQEEVANEFFEGLLDRVVTIDKLEVSVAKLIGLEHKSREQRQPEPTISPKHFSAGGSSTNGLETTEPKLEEAQIFE